MTDLYELVLVERATGRVRHHYKGPWPAIAADRLRQRVEAHIDAERYDVCLQRLAEPYPAAAAADELVDVNVLDDGLQL
jgi:hypothetical protein